jgi:hypothetical protein
MPKLQNNQTKRWDIAEIVFRMFGLRIGWGIGETILVDDRQTGAEIVDDGSLLFYILYGYTTPKILRGIAAEYGKELR